eukprot:7091200-Ditylum_brightwellii.AAC.2
MTTQLVPSGPICLTIDPGTHTIVMDKACCVVADTSSDLGWPTPSHVQMVRAAATVILLLGQ